jgi:hypothetical protein
VTDQTRTEYRVGWKNHVNEASFSTATTDREQAERAYGTCVTHPFRRGPWMETRTVTVTETPWKDIEE